MSLRKKMGVFECKELPEVFSGCDYWAVNAKE